MSDIHDIKIRYVLDDSQLKSGNTSVVNLVKTQDGLTSSLAKTSVQSDAANKSIQSGAVASASQMSGLKGVVSGVTGEIASAASGMNVYGLNAGTAFSALSKGLSGGVQGFNLLKLAIAGTGIGLLLVAFASLAAYFTKTELGVELLERGMAALGAIFGVIVGKIADFGSTIVSAFKNPVETLKSLGQAIVDNVINRFKAFGVIAEAIANFDFKKLGDGVLQVATGVTNATDKAKALANGFASVASEATNAAKSAIEIERALQDVADDERNLSVEVANTRNQIQLLIIQSKNRAATEAQRVAALNQADALETQIVNKQIALQLKKVDALQKESDQKVKNKEIDNGNQTEALTQAEIELANLRGNSIELLAKNQNRADALAVAAAKVKTKTLIDLNKTILDEVNKNASDELDKNIETNDAIVISDKDAVELKRQVDEGYAKDTEFLDEQALQASLDKYDKDKAAAVQAEQAKQVAIKQIKQEALQTGTQIANSLFNLSKQNSQAELTNLTNSYNQQIKLAGDNVQLQAQINSKYNADQSAIKRKQAQLDKDQALFSIGINTAVAVTKVIPNPILIALAVAAGLAQAIVVESQPLPKFNKGTKYVPGNDVGNRDTILASLTVGEAVVPRDKNAAYSGILGGIIDGTLDPRFNGLAQMDYNKIEKSLASGVFINDNSKVVSEIQSLKQAVKELPISTFEVSEKGFKKYQRRANNETEFLNDYFKN